MNKISPYFKILKMLVISKSGSISYNQEFHSGVNIIRGHNSSGKSTIANLIFYGLGGDFSHWTDSAQDLDLIFLEVEFNNKIVTLKRNIRSSKRNPMYLYWDILEKAFLDNANWTYLSYRKTKDISSFSDILFDLLNFPNVKSDLDEKITMHQILRLLYIDQDSLTQSLFRTEQFDSSLIRQTISELLLGIYEDELYKFRQRQLEIKKLLEDKKNNLSSLDRVFEQSGMDKNVESISLKIEETENEINKIRNDITEIISKDLLEFSDETSKTININNAKLSELKSQYNSLLNEITKLEYEIKDTSNFIRILKERLQSSYESKIIRGLLKDLPINFCPHCLQELNISEDKKLCILCNKPLIDVDNDAQLKRIEFEIGNQVSESEKINLDNMNILTDLKNQLNVKVKLINFHQQEIDRLLSDINTGKGIKINEFHKRLGYLENQLNTYSQQLKYIEVISETEKEIQKLNEEFSGIKERISRKEERRKENVYMANKVIQDYTLLLLNSDLERQNEFKHGDNVNINYYYNTFDLNGKHNFSASSNVYFKNSILYALFFASLRLQFFRYPRFILCDNMEDKGMEKERTQNFQKLIVKLSKESAIEHQIIFTTSMIDESLNNTELCVGEFYTETNKSLKL